MTKVLSAKLCKCGECWLYRSKWTFQNTVKTIIRRKITRRAIYEQLTNPIHFINVLAQGIEMPELMGFGFSDHFDLGIKI